MKERKIKFYKTFWLRRGEKWEAWTRSRLFSSQDCLYHHPVHKISFIAQDMTDNRAFGYIYGSPENGHRFFGIKTEKAAGAVVVAMRDLFQVVFELKKKEMDEAKRQLGRDKEVGHESLKTFMLLIHIWRTLTQFFHSS